MLNQPAAAAFLAWRRPSKTITRASARTGRLLEGGRIVFGPTSVKATSPRFPNADPTAIRQLAGRVKLALLAMLR